MKTSPILLIILTTALSAPGLSFADDEKKGHGAGGVRADHASEKGLEKGKAWAGEKEKKEKKEPRDKGKKEKKEKKEKKAKKAKD
jgi:hypothetical protein